MSPPGLSARWSRLAFRLQLQLLLVLGQQPAALACTARRLQQDVNDAHALATRAHLLAAAGALAPAQALLEQLVALRPQQASAWFNLGYVLEQQHLPQAEAAFRRATQLAPQLDRAWYGLALCLIEQQRLDEAVAALRQSTELQPMSPHAWVQLARVHAQRQEPEQALHIIDHLRGFEPRLAALLLNETGLAADAASAPKATPA